MSTNKDMNRREFLKTMGAGTLATAAVAAGCNSPNQTVVEGTALGPVPTDKMTYRENLHGDKVSLLGYGCMRLPTIDNKDGRAEDAELDQERINELVDYAIAHGVNLFDTSPAYCKGKSEQAMGIALSRHKRSEYFISTKISNFGADSWSRQNSMAMYHNSLKALQVDHLDYVMLHGIGMDAQDTQGNHLTAMQAFEQRYIANGMLDFLVAERKAGRIRNLGFSYHGDIQVFDYLLSRFDEFHWDHVLIQHNYVDWHHAKQMNESNTNSEYLYGELEKRNIPVFVMEPLMGGQLATLSEHATAELKTRAPQSSIASWAFRFAASQPRILTVLSGMTYMENLQDNIRTYSPLKPLSDEEKKLLEEIANEYASFNLIPCTGCKYCMPCPYGLDIPTIFAHYNKCLNEGKLIDNDTFLEIGEDKATRADKKNYRKARREFLVGYDRSVPKLRQANHCVGCNKCLAHCPQGIPIPDNMQRIDKYVEDLHRTL